MVVFFLTWAIPFAGGVVIGALDGPVWALIGGLVFLGYYAISGLWLVPLGLFLLVVWVVGRLRRTA